MTNERAPAWTVAMDEQFDPVLKGQRLYWNVSAWGRFAEKAVSLADAQATLRRLQAKNPEYVARTMLVVPA